jgi:hypothetical protein
MYSWTAAATENGKRGGLKATLARLRGTGPRATSWDRPARFHCTAASYLFVQLATTTLNLFRADRISSRTASVSSLNSVCRFRLNYREFGFSSAFVPQVPHHWFKGFLVGVPGLPYPGDKGRSPDSGLSGIRPTLKLSEISICVVRGRAARRACRARAADEAGRAAERLRGERGNGPSGRLSTVWAGRSDAAATDKESQEATAASSNASTTRTRHQRRRTHLPIARRRAAPGRGSRNRGGRSTSSVPESRKGPRRPETRR